MNTPTTADEVTILGEFYSKVQSDQDSGEIRELISDAIERFSASKSALEKTIEKVENCDMDLLVVLTASGSHIQKGKAEPIADVFPDIFQRFPGLRNLKTAFIHSERAKLSQAFRDFNHWYFMANSCLSQAEAREMLCDFDAEPNKAEPSTTIYDVRDGNS